MKKPEDEVFRVLKVLKDQIDKIQKKGDAPGKMGATLDELQGYVNDYLNGEKSPPHYTVVRDVLNRVYINYMSDEDFDDNDKKVLDSFRAVTKVEAVPAQSAPLTSAQKPPIPPRVPRVPKTFAPSQQQEEVATAVDSKLAHKKNIEEAFDELQKNGEDWMRREGSRAEFGMQNAKLRYNNKGSDMEAVQSFLNVLEPKSVPGVGVKYISSHQKDIATKFMNTEGMKEAVKDPQFEENLRGLAQKYPQKVRELILRELPHPIARAGVLDIKEPERAAQSLSNVDDAINYLLGDAIRHVGAKGSAKNLLETAIYLIRQDLQSKEDSPEVISARDAMQKLDKQFRESVASNPLNKEKNNRQVRDCLAEIKDNETLDKFYFKNEKTVNPAKK